MGRPLRCIPAPAKAHSSFAVPPGSSPRLPPSTPSPACAGIEPEDRSWYPALPLRFLAADDPRTSLTPVGPSQDLHESTHGDQKPGGPCVVFLRERRSSPPPVLIAGQLAPLLRPIQASVSTTSSSWSSCARCSGPKPLLWPKRACRRCAAVPIRPHRRARRLSPPRAPQ
jgi:hypothetical protein